MKKLLFFFLVLVCFRSQAKAQDIPTYKIAIFVPLYIDSAFDDEDEYRYSKNVFPKFINPGLEFFEGAQLALDSLNKEKARLEVFVYDTRSTVESLAQFLAKKEMDSVQLIIAHCSANEVKPLADYGLRRNIPVVNANLPNDGGVSSNPYFVLLNPTLRTQVEGIYKYAQRYFALDPVVVFRKKGQLEDRIKWYFEDYSKSTMGSKVTMKFVDLPDSFTVNHLRQHLDTTNNTFCIAGSLDENFGKRLALQLANLRKQKYGVTVMGMPTWDGIRDFTKPEYKGVEIIYSTPFYHAKVDKISQSITNHFNRIMFARPSDMVFRGYEVTWRYAKLLMQFGKDLSSNLANKQNRIFTDFDIQPVLNKQSMTLDYFENKRLYFLKWQDGALKGVSY